MLNRKMIMRIVSAQQGERFGVVEVIEADDGSTAVEALRSEMAAGRAVDFVLMDFVMVVGAETTNYNILYVGMMLSCNS